MYHRPFMSAPLQPVRDAPRVPPFAAFLEGWRRVLRAPAVMFGVAAIWWAVVRFVSVASTDTVSLLEAVPTPGYWSGVVYGQLRELALAFSPELVPFFQAHGLPVSFVTFLLAESLVWLFFSGGAFDRFARGRRIGAGPFFSACGVYFFRFIRLMVGVVLAGVVIWQIQRRLPDHLYTRMAILVVVNILGVFVGFAKVRAVVEDRLSMIGAVAASVRFVWRRPLRVAALVFFNCAAMVVVLRLQYQFVSASSPEWLAPILAPVLVVFGVSVRLAVMASAVVFFQGELAHAGYTARPLPLWPDSPSVEALENLKNRVDNRPR